MLENERGDEVPLTELKGNQFGVRFKRRGHDDPHICIQIIGEDDEHWFDIGNSFSSFWIQDLIDQLETAKALLDARYKKDPSGFGYTFLK